MSAVQTSSIILLMAQIDDAPGELLGDVIGKLEKLGAKNVQLLPSLTKKGRPGYVMMVDIHADQENDAAALFAGELGVWGYRVLHAEHKHFDIRKFKLTLKIAHRNGEDHFPLRAKNIFNDGDFLRVKAEHDDLAAICASLTMKEVHIPLAVLKSKVETQLYGGNEPDTLSLSLTHST